MSVHQVAYDKGLGGESPDIYKPVGEAYAVESFEAVTDADIEFYRSHGYLVIEQAFTQSDVSDALSAISDIVAGQNGKFHGLLQFEAEAPKDIEALALDDRLDWVRKLQTFVDCDPRLHHMAFNDPLIGIVSRLLGDRRPAIYGEQALLKPPGVGREKPWHQDHAYFDLPIGTPIVGVWIALDPALPENGCMHVIPGSHLDGPVVHFQRRDWQICDTSVQLGKCIAAPLRPGGCLLFDGLIHHGTPPNRSDKRRRALQFHFYPGDVQRIATEERLAVFGSEGKDVTC